MIKKSLFFMCILILLGMIMGSGLACNKTNTNQEDQSRKNGNEEDYDRKISANVLQRLGIVKNEKPDVDLDVLHVFAPGLSELGAITSVLEAYDARIVVTKVIFFSGPIYEKWKETIKGKTKEVITPMRSSTTIMSTFKNLGYRVYVGYNKKAFKNIKDTYLKDRERDRYQEFKNEDEAVVFLKRLLSTGFPVMVQIDNGIIGGRPGIETVVVSGYNSDNFFINDPSLEADKGGKKQVIKNDQFLKAWGSGLMAKTPNLLFFVEGEGEPRPDVEILAEIKKESKKISSYLDADAKRLKEGKMSIKDFQSLANTCGAKRSALVVFLKEKNFLDISDEYNEIARFYGEIREETDPVEASKKLKKAAKMEKQAAKNWN